MTYNIEQGIVKGESQIGSPPLPLAERYVTS